MLSDSLILSTFHSIAPDAQPMALEYMRSLASLLPASKTKYRLVNKAPYLSSVACIRRGTNG